MKMWTFVDDAFDSCQLLLFHNCIMHVYVIGLAVHIPMQCQYVYVICLAVHIPMQCQHVYVIILQCAHVCQLNIAATLFVFFSYDRV